MTITVTHCTPEQLRQIQSYFATVFPDATVSGDGLEQLVPRKTKGLAFVTVEGISIEAGQDIVCYNNRRFLYRVVEFTDTELRLQTVGEFEYEWEYGERYPKLNRITIGDHPHPKASAPKEFYPYTGDNSYAPTD